MTSLPLTRADIETITKTIVAREANVPIDKLHDAVLLDSLGMAAANIQMILFELEGAITRRVKEFSIPIEIDGRFTSRDGSQSELGSVGDLINLTCAILETPATELTPPAQELTPEARANELVRRSRVIGVSRASADERAVAQKWRSSHHTVLGCDPTVKRSMRAGLGATQPRPAP